MSRRREHLHASALQIRAELSTHIHRETGLGLTLRQRQAHNAVRHASRSRPARSAIGHRARTRCLYVYIGVGRSVESVPVFRKRVNPIAKKQEFEI